MATTTVRLDADEEVSLDELAEAYGGRSNALRAGLRLLAEASQRRAALASLLADWEAESGTVGDDAVDVMRGRYRLDS